MGLFDDVGSALKSTIGQAEAAGIPALISIALQKSNLGNLQNLATKLEQGGLNEQVKSWLGNGPNLPVTAEQLRGALGDQQVKQLAEKFGIPIDGVLKLLADHLPTVVDQSSPNGELKSAA